MKHFFYLLSTLILLSGTALATTPESYEPMAPTLDIEVSVFPNPSDGAFFLNIKSEVEDAYHVRVVNLIGQSVWESDITANHRQEIDLSSAPKGVYFVQITVEDEKVVKRVILQ